MILHQYDFCQTRSKNEANLSTLFHTAWPFHPCWRSNQHGRLFNNLKGAFCETLCYPRIERPSKLKGFYGLITCGTTHAEERCCDGIVPCADQPPRTYQWEPIGEGDCALRVQPGMCERMTRESSRWPRTRCMRQGPATGTASWGYWNPGWQFVDQRFLEMEWDLTV
jgi:hypothetical protein